MLRRPYTEVVYFFGVGKAVQVDIKLTPRVETTWFQLLESTVLSSPLVSDANPHLYDMDAAPPIDKVRWCRLTSG